jgi:hypothetical protein
MIIYQPIISTGKGSSLVVEVLDVGNEIVLDTITPTLNATITKYNSLNVFLTNYDCQAKIKITNPNSYKIWIEKISIKLSDDTSYFLAVNKNKIKYMSDFGSYEPYINANSSVTLKLNNLLPQDWETNTRKTSITNKSDILYVQVQFTLEAGGATLFTENCSTGLYAIYKNPLLENIFVSKEPRKLKYYANEEFDYKGLEVKGTFRFILSGEITEKIISSYDLNVSMLPDKEHIDRQVEVKHENKSDYFAIEVHSVASVSYNYIEKYHYSDNEFQPVKAVITYTDGTTEEQTFSNASYDPYRVGKQSFTLKSSATKTKEEFEKEITYQVVGAKKIILLNSLDKSHYDTNDKIEYNGLRIASVYDLEEETVVDIDYSNLVFIEPDMTTSGKKNVKVNYFENEEKYEIYVPITVEGLKSIDATTENVELRISKNGTYDFSKIKVFANFVYKDREQIYDYTIHDSEVDFNSLGEKQVRISYEYHGITKETYFTITVYQPLSLSLEGGLRKTFSTGGKPVQYQQGDLVVYVNYTDGVKKQVTTYTVDKNLLSLGENRITVSYSEIGETVTAQYSVTVIEDYLEEVTEIVTTNFKNKYRHGEVFTSVGIVVKGITASGIREEFCPFTTNYDGHIFNDSVDVLGEQTIKIIVNVNGVNEEFEEKIFFNALATFNLNVGNSFATIYKVGEKINLNTIKGECVLMDGTTFTVENSLLKFSEINISEVGEKNIIVSSQYSAIKYSTLTVNYVALEGMVVSTIKTYYERGQQLDLNAINVELFYTNNILVEPVNFTSLSNVVLTTKNGSTTSLRADSKETDNTIINVAYKGITTTFSIKVKEVREVKVYQKDTNILLNKISLYYGQTYSLNGYKYDVVFNNGDVLKSSITNSSEEIITRRLENRTFAYTYNGETTYSNSWEVNCVSLERLEAEVEFNDRYFVGDNFTLKNIKLYKQYKTTDLEEYPEGWLPKEEISLEDEGLQLTPQFNSKMLSAGEKNFVVKYTNEYKQSIQSAFPYLVENVELTGISFSTNSEFKNLESYIERQNLNLNGLVITAIYNRAESNTEIELNKCEYYIGDEMVSPTVTMKTNYNGKVLSVEYNDKRVEIGTLAVAEDTLAEIRLNENSKQDISYLIGDKFSKEGLFVTATYLSGYKEIIGATNLTTNLDNKITSAFTKDDLGTKEVVVTYTNMFETKSCHYEITVSAPILRKIILNTSLLVLNPTNKTAYSINNLIVIGEFENGYTENINEWTSDVGKQLNLNSENIIQCENNLGAKKITVTAVNPYNKNDIVTSSFNVTVSPNTQLLNIFLTFDEEQKPFEYRVGETFDAKGLIVKGEFQDQETSSEVFGWTTFPELNSVLRSGGKKTVTVTYEYKGVIKQETYEINVLMAFESGYLTSKTHKIAFNIKEVVFEEVILNEETLGFELLPLYDVNLLDKDENPTSEYYGKNVLKDLTLKDSACVGYVKKGKDTSENAHIVFFEDVTNPISGDGNIIVKFPHYVEGNYEKIAKCTFGIIYNNRMFLSGNPEFKNIDWHSGQINTSQTTNYELNSREDYTYFSDLDYCIYGSEKTKITGYEIFKDGSLVVLKEFSPNETTIFKRNLEYINATDFAGNIYTEEQLTEESFPRYDVSRNGGLGGISNATVVNFNGETIFITKEGLKRLITTTTNNSTSKILTDVSTKINHRIINEDLENMSLFAYKNKLFLRTNRGVYVGENEATSEEYNYEWYFLNGFNCSDFFVHNDSLYLFGTDGSITKFENEIKDYTDKKRVFLSGGAVGINSENRIYVSQQYADLIKEGQMINISNNLKPVHSQIGKFINENQKEDVSIQLDKVIGTFKPSNNTLEIYETDDFDKIYEDKRIFLKTDEGVFDQVELGKEYFAKEVQVTSVGTKSFKIADANGNILKLAGVSVLNISCEIGKEEVCYISDIQPYLENSKSFEIKNANGETIQLYDYYERDTYVAVATDEVVVEAYFITKPYDLSSEMYYKTLWQVAMVNDTEIPSVVELGYLVSRKQGDFLIKKDFNVGAKQFALDKDFSFGKTQLLNDKLPRDYVRDVKERQINYVRFALKNNTNSNLALTKLLVVYSIEKMI